jgi:ribosome maturation factor RimP
VRAIVLDSTVQLDASRPAPTPAENEVLVRVTRAGVCETDLQLIRGYMGFRGVLGHEFVGVAESGDLAGQRVVGEINCACGECPTCRAGRPTHCPERTTIGIAGHDGALADYVLVPLANLHRVPPRVPDRQAVFAEPLAAALEIPERAHIRPSERVIVLGDGKLGLLAAQVLGLLGCELVAIELLGAQGVGRHRVLRVSVDKPGGASIEDCTRISRALSPALDAEDIISSSYDLEVSTPGMDVAVGAGQSEQVAGMLGAILEAASRTAGRMAELNGRMERVQESAVALSDRMAQLGALAEENAASAEEMAGATQELDQVAASMQAAGQQAQTYVQQVEASVTELEAVVTGLGNTASHLSELAGALQQTGR